MILFSLDYNDKITIDFAELDFYLSIVHFVQIFVDSFYV